MIAPYRLRPAAVLDALDVVEWFPTRREAVLWAGPGAPDPLTASWLAREVARPPACHYALVGPEDALAGFFGVAFHQAQRRAHLIRFALAPELRGRGLGPLLAEAAIEVARSQGAAERLTLQVYAANIAARRTYEVAGFAAHARTGPTRDDGGEVIRMAIEL